MPESDSEKFANEDMEKLLLSIYSYIPDVVRNACHSLGRHPQQIELDGIAGEITLLLMDDDYYVLKSFTTESDDLKSEFSKWLFTIAWRSTLHRFQKQDKIVSLEDLPANSLALSPDQEAAVELLEREGQLQAALQKLTTRELLLFELIRRGLRRKDIAEALRIQPKSVSPMKNALLKKKIPRIIQEDEERRRRDRSLKEHWEKILLGILTFAFENAICL